MKRRNFVLSLFFGSAGGSSLKAVAEEPEPSFTEILEELRKCNERRDWRVKLLIHSDTDFEIQATGARQLAYGFSEKNLGKTIIDVLKAIPSDLTDKEISRRIRRDKELRRENRIRYPNEEDPLIRMH